MKSKLSCILARAAIALIACALCLAPNPGRQLAAAAQTTTPQDCQRASAWFAASMPRFDLHDRFVAFIAAELDAHDLQQFSAEVVAQQAQAAGTLLAEQTASAPPPAAQLAQGLLVAQYVLLGAALEEIANAIAEPSKVVSSR
jgi:hypothetical protein